MSTKHPSIIPNHYIVCIGFEEVNKNEHMFEWLGLNEPYLTTLVKNLETHLYDQDPGSIISKVTLLNEPEFITGYIPMKTDPGQGIICRLIVNMNIDVLIASATNNNYILHIKYAFHGQDLDNERRKLRLDMNIINETPAPKIDN